MIRTAQHEAILRKLTVRDDRYIEYVLEHDGSDSDVPSLDAKTSALVRLGALIALDAPTASYQWIVEAAVAAGASTDEVIGALIAVLPTTGVPRVTSAASRLGLALGYDVDAALEVSRPAGRLM